MVCVAFGFFRIGGRGQREAVPFSFELGVSNGVGKGAGWVSGGGDGGGTNTGIWSLSM